MSRRSPDPRNDTLDRIDPEELKIIKVTVRKRNFEGNISTAPLQRSLDDPFLLKIHYRPEEGNHPIFHKLFPPKEERSLSQAASRSSRGVRSQSPPRVETKSPQAHCSKDYSRDEPRKDYSRSDDPRRDNGRDETRKDYHREEPPRKDYNPARYRSFARRSRSHSRTISRSPHKYRSSRSPESRRRKEFPHGRDKSPPHRHFPKQRSSRSPADRSRRYSRSPQKHSERKRTRSPPSRGRPRSRSRSRYSRSPHRHDDYRRYERSPRRRSRSPRRHSRYSPERSSRDDRIYPPRIPPQYFEPAEFWIPNPMLQPRFIPRHMIPPAAFPYPGFRPGMPPPFAARAPFKPRIVYNSGQRGKTAPAIQASAEGKVVEKTKPADGDANKGQASESQGNEGSGSAETGGGQTEHSEEKKD